MLWGHKQGMFARPATFVSSILALGPSITPRRELPQTDQIDNTKCDSE